MEAIDRRRAEPEALRAWTSRAELAAMIAQFVPEDGPTEMPAGVMLRRASAPTEMGHGLSYPSFCVIAQGSKEILLGESRYRYDPAHYLITSAALPIATRVIEASQERPYLAFVLRLDPTIVGSVLAEAAHPMPRTLPVVRAIDVSPLDMGLLDAVVRLVRLLDAPVQVPFLAPLIIREIIYRLLLGEQGGRLGHITALGGSTHRIAAAVERLRQEFAQPLHIEDVAREVGMSVSGFHHHFKALTAMSPLQFQKQLRLQEARRLLLAEEIDAASAGRRVGYDDPAYFSREYKRLFGAPPLRHAAGMRETVTENAGL